MRRADYRPSAALAAFALGTLVAPAPARASCTVSATAVAFGAYNPSSGAPDDATGTINATCLIWDDAPIVSIGTGVSGSFAPRKLANGAARLNYNLYTAATRTIVWGDGSAGTSRVTLTGGTTVLIWRTYARTIYGRIPIGQHVQAGTYTDTIVVTVTF